MKLVSTRLYNSGTRLEDVEFLDEDVVLQLHDRIEDSFLEETISTKGSPGFIIATWFSYFDAKMGVPINCVPIWLEFVAKFFKNHKLVENPITEKNFNFLINKKQINRYLAIKFVQHFNLLDNALYTYSGAGRTYDMGPLLEDIDVRPWMTPDLKDHLLKPIDLATNWIAPSADNNAQMRASESQILKEIQEGFARPDYGYLDDDCGGLVSAYFSGINKLMDKTAISLITESNVFELSTTWTNHSLWPVLSLTLPIWIGGYRQADEWKRMGFDTFDDVINHRYQYCYSMIERCYCAVADNLNLLQDLELAQSTREKMMPRLLANRDLMLSDHLYKFNNEIINSWPQEVQDVSVPILELEFRSKQHFLHNP